jgi:hypothetical protein
MSSNINSNNVTFGFHTPSVVTMGGGVDPHKQMTSVFQQVVEYNQHMFDVLLKMSRLKFVNQHMVENKQQVQNSLK